MIRKHKSAAPEPATEVLDPEAVGLDGAPESRRDRRQDAKKKSLMNADLADIFASRPMKKRRGKAVKDPTHDWRLRANLLPKTVAVVNRDRTIKRLMIAALVAIFIATALAAVGMRIAVVAAQSRTEEQRELAISLLQTKAKYSDVEKIVDASNDTQKVLVSTLYGEVDWLQVTENLNKALPSGTSYTSLSLSE